MKGTASPYAWSQTKTGLALRVKARPAARGAERTARLVPCAGEEGEAFALELSVREAATDGKANAALVALLAKALSVPRSAVRLKSGQTSRQKIFLIDGDPAALSATAAALWGETFPTS